jgi:hypothetical protein
MANVPSSEFQKLWSNLIEYLRLEHENLIQQHPGSDAVIELVRGVFTAIARLVGSTHCVSLRKSEMDSNPSKRGHQEESPPVSERKAAV